MFVVFLADNDTGRPQKIPQIVRKSLNNDTGRPNVEINTPWTSNFDVGSGDREQDVPTISPPEKDRDNIRDNLMELRKTLHRTAYQHKTVKKLEQHLEHFGAISEGPSICQFK